MLEACVLMLRIVWFSIFFNYIEKQGQKSGEDDQGKLLMLRIVWFLFFNCIEKQGQKSGEDDQGKLLMLPAIVGLLILYG